MLDPQHSLRLDPSTVMLWRMQRLIRMVLVGIPTMIAIGIAASTAMRTELVVVAVMTLIAMNIVFTLFWPAFEYNAFRYMVREDDLLVQSGVIFRRWSSIPHNRIQHVDTRQGPIERVFGLSRLLVFTAAGMSADGSIPGLATDDAERLRDQLSRRGGDDGV
jgi:membrane protein YdbS with pleckstrin-like domain